MSAEFHNSKERGGLESPDGFDTLRAVAKLPAPEYLADRVHERLRRQAIAEESGTRRDFWASTWGLWRPAQRLQFAGAAVLALAVAGSTWSVYHARGGQSTAAQSPTQAPVQKPSQGPVSGFSSAKAERVPPSLKPILVPPVAHKKPGAGKTAPKPSQKAPGADAAAPANP